MSKCSEWIEDMLGAAKQSQNMETIQMIECCGKGCANRKNADTGIQQMKVAASDCKTRADYAAFFNKAMPIEVVETEDGILLYLGKEECSCPMAHEITQNADILC